MWITMIRIGEDGNKNFYMNIVCVIFAYACRHVYLFCISQFVFILCLCMNLTF